MCHRFLIIKSFLDNQGCVVDLIKQTTDSSSLYPQIRTQWSLTDSQQLLLIKCFSHSSRYLHILKKTRYGASNTNVMNSKSFCWKPAIQMWWTPKVFAEICYHNFLTGAYFTTLICSITVHIPLPQPKLELNPAFRRLELGILQVQL